MNLKYFDLPLIFLCYLGGYNEKNWFLYYMIIDHKNLTSRDLKHERELKNGSSDFNRKETEFCVSVMTFSN